MLNIMFQITKSIRNNFMKKILLILFITLFSTSLFAGINEPGSGGVNEEAKNWYKEKLNQRGLGALIMLVFKELTK